MLRTQQEKTDRAIPNNKSDVITRDNGQRTCVDRNYIFRGYKCNQERI
jgi:hypothetical protein